jgi:hypothetical protein
MNVLSSAASPKKPVIQTDLKKIEIDISRSGLKKIKSSRALSKIKERKSARYG